MNKTALSARSNREIGGNKPSTYLETIQSKYTQDSRRLDTILESHLINPQVLRQDEFERFIQDRAYRLLDLIEQATGKAVTGRDSEETVKAFGVSLLGESKELR